MTPPNHRCCTRLTLLALAAVLSVALPRYALAGPGYALWFDGVDDYVDMEAGVIPSSGDFTVECWVYCAAAPGAYRHVLSQGSQGNAFYIGTDLSNNFRFGDYWYNPGIAFPVGAWHHVAVVKTSTNTMFYLDGTNRLNRGSTIVNPGASTGLRLGRQFGTLGEYWQGGVDEVRIWSAARTEAQIRANKDLELTGREANLVGYWRFREGASSVVTRDATDRGHNGRLFNRPRWIPSPVGATPEVRLLGASVITNQCPVAFVDPGAVMFASPVAVKAGQTHSLALRANGTVFGWGLNADGQTTVPANATNVVAIAADGWHSLALKADGMVLAWGRNDYGQTTIPTAATNVVAIAAGRYHSLALKADGMVLAWGRNNDGQTTIPADATNVVAIAAGGYQSWALKADGTVVKWGYSFIPANATNVVAMAAGMDHILLLKAEGTVLGWGLDMYGETIIPAAATNVVEIAASYYVSLALKADGTVLGWGNNADGQRSIPAYATNVVAIAAGGDHSLALTADGTVLGWGRNDFGQASVPNEVFHSGPPVVVSGAVQANSPGRYIVTYYGTNLNQTTAVTNRSIWVVDPLPPSLSLNGPNLMFTPVSAPFSDPGSSASDLCAGNLSGRIAVTGTVNTNLAGTYELTYSVVDDAGNTAHTNRVVVVYTPPSVPGDLNGDGTVDSTDLAALLTRLNGTGVVRQADLDLVLARYWPGSPWLQLTNPAGLGETNVTFALTNSAAGAFSVECSTNLADWHYLGPAVPRYEFTDTNAPAIPSRFYRLRWP